MSNPVPTDSRGVFFPVAESAAYTATQTFGPFANVHGARALIVVIKSTVEVDTASVDFKIQGKDPVTGATWDILTSTAITDDHTTIVLRVSPDLAAAANTIAKDHVPVIWQLVATHADADALTYSIGAQYVG